MPTAHYYTDLAPGLAPGVGLSFRPQWMADLVQQGGQYPAVRHLEIIADHFLLPTALASHRLRLLQDRYPLLPHSLNLSLAGPEGPEAAYLRHIARLAAQLNAPWLSDHLAVTHAQGRHIGHLAPPVWDAAHLDILCHNIERVQRAVPVPLLLEPIAYGFVLPGAQWTEAEFLHRVVDRTGVGLLLDVTNLWINTANHHAQPHAEPSPTVMDDALNALPLRAVVQLHLAGGHRHGHRHIDSHSAPVPPPVWALLARVLARCPNVRSIILERDDNLPPLATLYPELVQAQQALHSRPPVAPAPTFSPDPPAPLPAQALADARERQHLAVRLYTDATYRARTQANPTHELSHLGYAPATVQWARRLPWPDIQYYAQALVQKRWDEARGHLPRLTATLPPDQLQQAFAHWAATRPPQGWHKPAEDAWRFARHLRPSLPTAQRAAATLDALEARLATGRPHLALARAEGHWWLGYRWRHAQRLHRY